MESTRARSRLDPEESIGPDAPHVGWQLMAVRPEVHLDPEDKIRIGVVGVVLRGQGHGHFIKVEDDRAGTGGYYVLWGHDRGLSKGSDNWVEDWNALVEFFEELGLEVQWSTEQGS